MPLLQRCQLLDRGVQNQLLGLHVSCILCLPLRLRGCHPHAFPGFADEGGSPQMRKVPQLSQRELVYGL